MLTVTAFTLMRLMINVHNIGVRSCGPLANTPNRLSAAAVARAIGPKNECRVLQSLTARDGAGLWRGRALATATRRMCFGRRPRSDATGPFTIREFSRLLVPHSRV